MQDRDQDGSTKSTREFEALTNDDLLASNNAVSVWLGQEQGGLAIGLQRDSKDNTKVAKP